MVPLCVRIDGSRRGSFEKTLPDNGKACDPIRNRLAFRDSQIHLLRGLPAFMQIGRNFVNG